MNKFLQRSVSIILLLSFILSSLPCVVYAEVPKTLTRSEAIAQLGNLGVAIDGWYNQFNGSIRLLDFRWTENDVEYSAFFLNVPVKGESGRISFGYHDGRESLNTLRYKDENGKPQVVQISIKIDGTDILKRQQANYLEGYTAPMIEINPNGGAGTNPEVDSFVGKQAEITVILADGTKVVDFIPIGKVEKKNLSEDSAILKFLKTLGNIIFAPIEEVLKLVEKILTELILICADNILATVCKAVGESVTIDSVVLGETEKVSIDFWSASEGGRSVASILKGVVNYWYGIFRSIALIVYFIVLLIIGIKVLLASTGGAKAKYKDLIKDWIVGVALLLLFPYAMKMIVNVNDTLIKYVAFTDADTGPTKTNGINIDVEDSNSFGTDEFVTEAIGDGSVTDRKNTMMYVRYLAGKQGRIPLAIVYCIMIFQLIVILCVYYKRVFMLAFLITIFPLVAMTYTVDKLRWWAYKNKRF